MKTLDVESLLSGIDSNKKEIENFQERLSALQRAIRDFAALDNELGGEGGEAIRAFYNDCHQPFLIFLYQSLMDYKNVLIDIKQAVSMFEPHENGYISQSFLENEVESGLDEVRKTAIELTGEVNTVISSVSDIVSIPQLDETDVVHHVQRGKDKAQNIVEELNILDRYGVSQLEQTKQDLDTMMTYLSELESKFKSGDSIRNYHVKAIQDLSAYKVINDRIYNKHKETISALYGDNIDEMPMYEIEKMHKSTLKKLSEESQDVLNDAFNELKNGGIDRQDYLAFIRGLPAYEESLAQAKSPEDLSFYNLPESVQDLFKISLETSSQVVSESLKKIGIITDGMGATAKNFPVFKKTFNKIGDFFIKSGKLSHGVGNAAGYGVMGTGFGLGVYEDINYNDKTIGEAVSHNATSLGVGVLGQTGGTAAIIALTTNPGGWAILGGVAIGTLVTYGFNTAYKHNVFGIQDELDYIGQKLDQAGREVKELTTNFVENAGEAIKSSWDAINPINWGWGD